MSGNRLLTPDEAVASILKKAEEIAKEEGISVKEVLCAAFGVPTALNQGLTQEEFDRMCAEEEEEDD